MGALHRIDLGVFEGFEGQWVDIYSRRNFGTYLATIEAQMEGTRAYCMARFRYYVASWSFDGSPADSEAVESLEEDVAVYILAEAERHYSDVQREVRRSPEERKSAPRAISEVA